MLVPYNFLKTYINSDIRFTDDSKNIIILKVKEIKNIPLENTVLRQFKNNESIIFVDTKIDNLSFIIYAVNSSNEYYWLEHDLSIFSGFDNEYCLNILDNIQKYLKHINRQWKIKKILI